jgi:hypothetical protein
VRSTGGARGIAGGRSHPRRGAVVEQAGPAYAISGSGQSGKQHEPLVQEICMKWYPWVVPTKSSDGY